MNKTFIFLIKKQTIKDRVNNIKKNIEKYEKTGKKSVKENVLICNSFESFEKLFTANRRLIFHTILTSKLESIHDLAQKINKDYSNIVKEVNVLEEIGLIYCEEIIQGRKKIRIPKTKYKKVVVQGHEDWLYFAEKKAS